MQNGRGGPAIPSGLLHEENLTGVYHYKKFGVLPDIFNSTHFWKCLFALIDALYPVYCILCIADTMLGGMDKLYYYV